MLKQAKELASCVVFQNESKFVMMSVGGFDRFKMGGSDKDELIEVNKRESLELANAFLAAKFLHGQAKFLWKKGKYVPAMLFYTLLALRPIWGLTLK